MLEMNQGHDLAGSTGRRTRDAMFGGSEADNASDQGHMILPAQVSDDARLGT
jgi:hypothetical protein